MQGAPGGVGLSNLFAQQERAHNLPPGFLAQTAQIESGGNPNAYNKGSGAAGMFQVIPSTARSLGLGNPYDVVASTNAAAQLAGDNAASLARKLGRPPTSGELYLAHQQGAGGAGALLANPGARAGDIVGDAAVRQNGGDPNMTAGQFASLWTRRFDGGAAPQGSATASALGLGGVGGSAAPLRMLAAASPYGALDAGAFGPAGGASPNNISGLPTMAASGMGMALPQSGGFGPLATGRPAAVAATLPPVPGGGGVARTATGAPVVTDAQGNALQANGRPTAMGYAPSTGMVSAPGQQAIVGATGAAAGQPYGSVPLNVGGRMLTRQQAEDTDGLDHSDYDKAAQAQGMTPTPFVDAPDGSGQASGPPPSASVVTGSNVPGAPQATHIRSSAAEDGIRAAAGHAPLPTTSPIDQSAMASQPAGGLSRQAAFQLMSDPYASPAEQQMAATMLETAMKPREGWQTYADKDGSIWQRSSLTGETKLLQDNSASDDAWKLQEIAGRAVEVNSKTGETRTPNLGGQSGYRPLTPAEKQAYNIPQDSGAQMGPDGKITGIGGGTTVNVGGEAVTYDKQLAEALGKSHAALATGVEDAQARARDLNAMSGALDAIQRNGGTTGFGQSQMLQLKSAINSGANALGIDQPFDVSDPEFLTKFNRQIAGAQAKGAVGSRVTNFEMSNYLKSNPGLEMSPTGNRRLLGIQQQIEQRNIEVGNAIRNATAQAIAGGRKIDPTTVAGHHFGLRPNPSRR